MLSQALIDRYRCPGSFFDFALIGNLSSDEGFFQFGHDTTCYGRSCSGLRQRRVDSALYDMLEEAYADCGQLRLPFDPTEIIDNLRLERYVQYWGAENRSLHRLRKLYCLLRPLTNSYVRKQIKKFNTRRWQELSFPRWPVDTTVEDICESLLLRSMQAKGVDRVPFVWFWPNGAHGCVLMTHDVETEAGRDSCTDLMDFDDSYEIKASFQIVPEGRYKVSPAFLETIRRRSFEVAIHDLNHDGRLFDGREAFLRRAAKINRYAGEYQASGFRAGALYRRPEWSNDLDFSFDMSIPNVAHLDPQRGGCCTVMPYFVGDVLQLPATTIQDYTLFHLLEDQSIDLWKTQLELILAKNGLASFIIHPDYVRDSRSRSLYGQLLSHLRNLWGKRNVWLGLPSEVDSWWRARSNMSVDKIGNSWWIVGDQAERAVLAYATNVNGKLMYEVPGQNGAMSPSEVQAALV